MAKERLLKIVIAGDADKLEREVKRADNSLDKLGKQTRLTASITSKGFSGMRAAATGATAAIAGVALAAKRVSAASIEAEAATSKVRKSLENSGISWDEHGERIDRTIQKHSQLTGIDDEDLAEAFANMVRTTGNLTEAFELNALAADISRTKGIGLAQAQSLLARVYNGSFTGVKRLGIAIEPVTVAQDKLKASTAQATDEQVRAAKQADKVATRQAALAALQKAFGGQAEAYGKTTAGALDRAGVAVENLEESIGDALAPTIEKGANTVAKFVNEMQDGTGKGGKFVDKLKDIWQEVEPVVKWFGRATKNVAEFGKEHPNVAKVAGAILGLGVAVKALRFVSAVTGFSHLVKAGGLAAKGLHKVLSRAGTSAGTAAAENAAAGFTSTGRFRKAGQSAANTIKRMLGAGGTAAGAAAGTNAAASLGASGGKFGKAGRAIGRAAGKGLVVGLLVAIPVLLYELGKPIRALWRKLADELVERMKEAVQKLGRIVGKVGNIIGKANPFGDGIGRLARNVIGGAAQGASGGLMGASGALAPIAAVGASHGTRVSSGKRAAGGRTRSGRISYHGSGEAVDLVGSPKGMLATFRALKSRFGGRLAELIYTPGGVGIRNGKPHRYTGAVAADHKDHVHAAFDLGKPGPGIGDGPGRRIPGTGDGYGKSQIMNLWTREGGSAKVANLAASVALAESGGNPAASNRNTDGSIDRGLWQINSIHGALSTFSPAANARSAVKISSGGRNWRPWVAFTNGAYRRFLGVPGTSRSGSSSSGGSGGARASSANTEQAGSRIVNSVGAPFFADREGRNTAGRFGGGIVGGSRGITSLLRTAAGRERVIGEKDTELGQVERRFGQTDEDLGTAGGRAQRTSELAELRKLKAAQLKRQQQRLTALVAAVRRYDGLIRALRAKLKSKNAAKGAAAVRIRKRIRDFEDKRIELAAEARSLGSQIEDTKLDLGDIDKETSEVAATPNTADGVEAPSTTDRASGLISHIDAMERAGDLTAGDASAARVAALQAVLAGQFGALTDGERLQVRGDLRQAQLDATQASTAATSALAEALAANTASNAALLAAHNGIAAITSREAIRAMADVMSGQMGQGVAARGRMPGSGQLARL